jgi:site-specific DNA recombinase
MIAAAIYARVSTTQQEKEATIESQIAALQEYASQQGYKLDPKHQFIDQAVSGARLNRPGLDRLRDLASEQHFKVVLCLSPDRLARQYVYQRLILDELATAGVKMLFLSQPEVADTPQAELMLGLQGLFAEYERAAIMDRMRRGRLHRLRTGQLMPNNPPYGYRYVPLGQPGGGKWHIMPHQAELVRDIFSRYHSGQRVADIVRYLNQAAIPSPKGKLWGDSTIRHILRDSAYRGQAYHNRKQTIHQAIGQPRKLGRGQLKEPRYQLRPSQDWITIEVPVIISEPLWQDVQDMLDQNKRFSPRNNHKHAYLLRGLLTCGLCGYTLVGRTARKRQTYYCRYGGGQRRPPDVPVHRCSIAADEIEALVWKALVELLQQPDRLTAAWRNLIPADQPQTTPLNSLQQRHKELDKQWQRLLDLFQDGLIEKQELADRKATLEAEKQHISQRLVQLNQQQQLQQYETDLVLTCQDFALRVEAALASPSFELKQDVIRLLIEQIVIHDDAIVIKHIVPAEDDPRLCRLEPTRTYP